jgi:hypothetical protein
MAKKGLAAKAQCIFLYSNLSGDTSSKRKFSLMNEERGLQKLFPCLTGCDKTKALQKKSSVLFSIINLDPGFRRGDGSGEMTPASIGKGVQGIRFSSTIIRRKQK